MRPSAGIGRLFMAAMQLSAVQKLVQSLNYNGRRFVEGVRVMLNTDFYTNIIRRYPIYIYIILSKLVFKWFKIYLYFYPGMYMDKFQQKSIICLYFFLF